MRYSISFDKTINQLTPHYIGGRKLILLMQALVSPLKSLNQDFTEYATEKRIETSMTSQILPFTWFLNRKFKKYFQSQAERITIINMATLGVPIYNENADIIQTENLSLYTEKEGKGNAFYYQNERTDTNTYSFIVHSPAIDTTLISKQSYLSMLTYWIERYRLAGKTYKIVFD
jgi:hypothetical protein